MQVNCLLLLLSLIFIFIPCLPSSGGQMHSEKVADANGKQSYVVLIDAGSSGTRVHVHPYTLPSTSSLPLISPSFSLKVKPGLSAYTDDPPAAAESIYPLLEFALNHVPPHLYATTPIYLYATAGLRTVPSDIAQLILSLCRDILRTSPFQYADNHVDLISGVQEGINGWIAINYLLDYFTPNVSNSSLPVPSTVGVLELGGASFQLTYAPLHPEKFPPGHLLGVTVGSTTYKVYTISYLNYGLEKAQSLYAEYHYEYIHQHKTDPCYPLEINPPRQHAQGHYDNCVALVDAIIRQERKEESLYSHHLPPADCSLSACSFGGYWIPPLHSGEQFLAIENFFYTSEFFDLLNRYENITDTQSLSSSISSASSHSRSDFPLFDLVGLKTLGRQFCSLSWSEILQRWPNEPRDDLTKYCFSAAYLPRILELGLGLENAAVSSPIQNIPTSINIDSRNDQANHIAEAAADAAVIEETVEMNSGVDPSTPLSPLMIMNQAQAQAQDESGKEKESIEINNNNIHYINIDNMYSSNSSSLDSRVPRIYITKQINGVTIDWALGAVLQQLVEANQRTKREGGK